MPFATRRFSCQRTAPASRRSLGTQLLRPQCDLQKAEIQDGAVEVLSEIFIRVIRSAVLWQKAGQSQALATAGNRARLQSCRQRRIGIGLQPLRTLVPRFLALMFVLELILDRKQPDMECLT